jgi:hypothetical protein
MTKKIISYRNFFILWGVLFLLLLLLFISSFVTGFGKTFFAELIILNIILFIAVMVFRNKLTQLIKILEQDFDRVNDNPTSLPISTFHQHRKTFGFILIGLITVFGIFVVFLAISSADGYRELIRENGVIESGSAIFWLMAAIVLLLSTIRKKIRDLRIIPYIGLILFFILCAGEEISWGQRIFQFATPDFISKINVQDETNIHNIGSISVFSNLFFIFSLAFFILLPVLTKKYTPLSNYLRYYSFPVPKSFSVYVFLITLLIWVIIGVRFGTLGFHPFSIYPQNYYTQMDDEMFEFLVAYSFLCYSILNALITSEVHTLKQD